jgi:hypothetical protein
MALLDNQRSPHLSASARFRPERMCFGAGRRRAVESECSPHLSGELRDQHGESYDGEPSGKDRDEGRELSPLSGGEPEISIECSAREEE